MFRIQDRKGRKVDILTVDASHTAQAAKGWREAIVSGPVLLEIRCACGARADLGRPTTTPLQNRDAFMDFLRS